MDSASFGISPSVKLYISVRLQHLLSDVPAILGAFLATDDGFEICHVLSGRELDPARLAAMSSSLVALSHALVSETDLGQSNNMIIEADKGTILLLSVPGDVKLALTVVARPGATLGQVLMMSKLAVADIQQRVS
ncbi:MAG: roadblock/LC7 domain-containing protein [Lysobacterales bacterium]